MQLAGLVKIYLEIFRSEWTELMGLFQVFQRFFRLKHAVAVAPSGEQLNRECSLFTGCGRFVIVGSACYVPEDLQPDFFDIFRNNESVSPHPRSPLEDCSLHIVDLIEGRLVDTRTMKTDKIFLSHNQGLYLYQVHRSQFLNSDVKLFLLTDIHLFLLIIQAAAVFNRTYSSYRSKIVCYQNCFYSWVVSELEKETVGLNFLGYIKIVYNSFTALNWVLSYHGYRFEFVPSHLKMNWNQWFNQPFLLKLRISILRVAKQSFENWFYKSIIRNCRFLH